MGMKMKKQNSVTLTFGIFALIGIGMLIGGIIFLMNGIRFRENAVEITATIVEIDSYRDRDGDRHHQVYVNYSFNGETYSHIRLGEYSSSMYEGKEITMLCNPDAPNQVKTTSGIYLAGGILILMGVIFTLTGTIPLILSIRRSNRQKKLLTDGQILHATVDSITRNRNIRVNGRSPYVLYCSYRDEYKDVTYRFKSNNLWSDPGLIFSIGGHIDVYVDRNDYSNYYVNAEQSISERIIDYT